MLLFCRLSETLDQFSRKLESVYTASGGKKINLITHSMGGLLVKCFMSLHGDVSASHYILDFC
jgi:triacylglycerol esterase/lipase EstA (alpha/beta hydrolase family)